MDPDIGASSVGVIRRAGRFIALLALLLGLLALPSAAHGAGELDPSFDGDGRVLTDFGGDDFGSGGVAIQADGKIVSVGRSDAGAQPAANFALARHNPDGSLDPTFDGDGRVVTDFGSSEGPEAVAIQADGKIVAAGLSGGGADIADFALARYNPDGSVDPTFDGDGVVLTDFGALDGANGIAIQADGKIVAAGTTFAGDSPANFALARYNPDGSLDPTFDGDGRVLTDFGSVEGAGPVVIQADGKIVAVGQRQVAGGFGDFALARYNPDGSLDPTFDGDGRVLTDFLAASDTNDGASGVAIQADGKIVAAGFTSSGADPGDFALARYDTGGSLDPTFDGDGRVVTDFSGTNDFAGGVAIQEDGKIVAAGESDAGVNPFNFALGRYNPDGSLDPTFDGDGRVLTDFGSVEGALGVAIQADGKIVAAGFSNAGANPVDFALARYLPGPVNLPPDCSTVAASPNTLWPPNHGFRLVTLSGGTDPDGDTVTLTITAVTQDEPVNGKGDGNTSPDARQASAQNKVFLRAERSAQGNGRVYRIALSASDGKGGTCEGTAKVAVPHNPGRPAVDSAPPSYNSFGP